MPIGRGLVWSDITRDRDLEQMKQGLLATVSHEFRTPLALIKVVRVFRPLTNGGTGLTLPPTCNVPLWFYVQLILVLVLLAFSWWLRRTRFGASLVAIREDETGAS